MTRNQGALIGRVGSFSELLKFTVLSDVLASATSICDKVDKSVRFLVTLLKKKTIETTVLQSGQGVRVRARHINFSEKKMLDEFILCSHSFSAVKHVLESIWHHINVKPAYLETGFILSRGTRFIC